MRTSKAFKRGISLLSLLALLLAGEILFTSLLEPISFAVYFKHDLSTFEATNADVDLVFVGASRVYRSFVPNVFEAELGTKNVINAGSSSQHISGSYYQMKDLIERFHPEYVVLGVTGGGLCNQYDLQSNLIVLDRLQGLNKFAYILNIFDFQDWPYALLKSYRFKTNLTAKKITENIQEKKELFARNYQDDPANKDYYEETGFIFATNAYEPGNVEISGGLNSIRVFNDTEISYLNKIVDLCTSTDTQLFLVTAPTTMSRVFNGTEYQYYHDWYANFAKENDLIYHDLNFLKTREDILPDSSMRDINHVNGKGAYTISKVYAEILQKTLDGEPTDHYFYSSREELMMDVDRIVAVDASIEINDNIAQVEITSLHNDAIVPSYQISVSYDNVNNSVLVDWTTDAKFAVELPDCDDYTIMVRAKAGVNEETEAFQYYRFHK